MKKLEKLTLRELEKTMSVIDLIQVSKLRGGDCGSGWAYYNPGEAYCYGGPGGAAARALLEVGNCEASGGINTDRIMQYFTSCNGSFSNQDPWCSAFVNSMLQASGMQGTSSAWAQDWENWGNLSSNPQVGDIALTGDDGHVGIVTAVVNGVVYVTSGNSGGGCVTTTQYGGYNHYRTGGN